MRICLLCQALSDSPHRNLCPGCEADLPWINSQCRGCGLPLPPDADQLHCGECLATATPFSQAITPLYYRKPLSQLINGFKHQHRLIAGELLGQLLAQEIRDHYVDHTLPEAIIPVPLYWQRFLWRGYNQSAVLGKQLSKELQLPCLTRHVKRLHKTPRQQGLSREERLCNLKNAFRIQAKITFTRLALLDDVVTTGSTARELAKVLLKAGATEVHLWAIARTPP